MKIFRTLFAIKQSLLRVMPLMRHERVPFALKAGTLAVAVLIVSPVDLLSDIPVLGLLDDAALLSILCYGFVQLASRHAATASVPVAAPRFTPDPR